MKILEVEHDKVGLKTQAYEKQNILLCKSPKVWGRVLLPEEQGLGVCDFNMHIKETQKYDCNLGEIRQNQEGDTIQKEVPFNIRIWGFLQEPWLWKTQRQGAILKAKLHGSKTENKGGVFKSFHFHFPTSKRLFLFA